MGSIPATFLLYCHPPSIKSCRLPRISVTAQKNGSATATTLRRNLMIRTLLTLVGGLSLATADCSPSQAFSLGISGPKEWLKEQKKKTAKFLLAPIAASRDRLNNAYDLLKLQENTSNTDIENIQRLVKVAARDCIPLEEGSFVAFQSSTGVEVCTFNLILNNASSLMDNKDPTKLKADVALQNLVRSFTLLDGLVENGGPGIASNSEKLGGALVETLTSLDNFETSIKDCLGI